MFAMKTRFLLVGASLLVLSGCTRQIVMAPQAPPVVYPTEPRVVASPGSLWVDQGSASFISDDKAMRVGDILTVEVVTATTAEETAKTNTDRKASVEANITNLFGIEDTLPRTESAAGAALPPLIKANSQADFGGSANTNRSGKITARLSAVVTDVYPNGNMRIHGSEAIAINNERSILTVEGIIRPSDVTLYNTVRSTQIANARIEYTGRGVVSDVQRPGLGTRAFNKWWLF